MESDSAAFSLIAGLPSSAHLGKVSPQKRAVTFRNWAAQHAPTPLLSKEAISRESIYGERGLPVSGTSKEWGIEYSDPICQDNFSPYLRWSACRVEQAFQPG